jgi:signal transduction histidine kinase/CheY-like chemotaxis protein
MASGAFAAVHLAEDQEALRLAVEADPLWLAGWCIPQTVWSLKILTILGATLPFTENEQDSARRAAFTAQRARLVKLAVFNPSAFRHAFLLVEAGEARTGGQHEQAERLYEQAIEQAARRGFVNDEALALRLHGEYLLSCGLVRMARATLRDAHDAYLRWEATAAAAVLRRKYPEMFPEAGVALAEPAGASARTSTSQRTRTTTGPIDSQIDVVSLLKAAQALSSDRDLDSLIARMLRLLAENAGAQRAILVLAKGGQLVIRAELVVEPERLTLHPNELVEGSALLPATVVQYVARSHEPLVLGREGGVSVEGDGGGRSPSNAGARFDDDPYLKHRRPASMLLVPLSHQGRLLGVMVLEHASAADAFPEARVQVVSLLATQAATAVENAALYTELSTSHQRLERQVDERTAELKAAKEAADAASHAKSDFLSSMSHELRSPLNGILGYAQILARAADLPPQHHGAVQIIRKSGEHLLTLINDVLDLAKIEAGKLELLPRHVHLPALLRTVLGMSHMRAEAKGLSFRIEQEGAAFDTVLADEKRLMQVLLNLLGNAIKFTERGRVVLRVQAGAACADGDGPRRVRFRIEDTGPGISPEHLAKIFEPFEQVGAERARAEGTGLGLAITRRIVDLMGGSIRVESQLGQGSVFEVDVPLIEVSAALAEHISRPWERLTGYEGTRRALLVVDDQAESRAVIRDLLTPLGFRVLEASRGEQALELALAHRPDVIVMDLSMPGMDGYETTRRLRQLPELACIPVIASSASTSVSEHDRSASFGCNDFLPKPIEGGALLEKLEAQLGMVWICAEPPPPAAASVAPAVEAVRPTAEALARLMELANKGRVSRLLDDIERLRQEDARLGPFLDRLRHLAVTFQKDKVDDFLRGAVG